MGRQFGLYHCPQLAVSTAIDKSGNHWALIGHAFTVAETCADTPINSISRAHSSEVQDRVTYWSGRWLLLSTESVITDSGGLLGAFVLESTAGLFITGSLALLAELTDLNIRDERQLGWYGLNWFPGPLSKFRDVRRLLPDQTYNPVTRRISFFDRLRVSNPVTATQAAETIAGGLRSVFKQMFSEDATAPLTLALTGGLDSRTAYAALLASGIPFRTITLSHPRISRADKLLPYDISSRHQISHRFVEAKPPSKDMLALYDHHVNHCSFDGDRYFFSCGCYDELETRWLVRSGCWELGRQYFHTRLRGLELEELLENPNRLFRRFHTFARTEATAESLSEWVRWRLDHPINVPWQDAFYRDQRLAGWLSSIEHSLDLIDAASIHPVNCDRFFQLMLEANNQSEAGPGSIQRTIITLCAPALATLPINPRLDSWMVWAASRISKATQILSGESINLAKSISARLAP